MPPFSYATFALSADYPAHCDQVRVIAPKAAYMHKRTTRGGVTQFKLCN